MDLGKKIKSIGPNSNGYLINLLLGVLIFCASLVPAFRDGFLKKHFLFSIEAHKILFLVGLVITVYSLFKYVSSTKSKTIDIYEKGIKINGFRSKFKDLKIEVKSGIFIFSNGLEEIHFKERLSKEHYNYIRSL